MAELTQKLLKYKSYLESNTDGKKIDHIFSRLDELPITVAVLQNTGIGKVVNGFRKHEGRVGAKAKAIVSKWKAMVAEEALRLEAEKEADQSEGSASDSESADQRDEGDSSLSESGDGERNSYSSNKVESSRSSSGKHNGYANVEEKEKSSHAKDTSVSKEKSMKEEKNKHRSSEKHSDHSSKRNSNKKYGKESHDQKHKDKDSGSKVKDSGDYKSSKDKTSGHERKSDSSRSSKEKSKSSLSLKDSESSKKETSDHRHSIDKRLNSKGNHSESSHKHSSSSSSKEKGSHKDRHSSSGHSNERNSSSHRDHDSDSCHNENKSSSLGSNSHRSHSDRHRDDGKSKDKHEPKEKNTRDSRSDSRPKNDVREGKVKDRKKKRLVYSDDIFEGDSDLLHPSVKSLRTENKESSGEESPGHLFFDRHLSKSKVNYSGLSPDHGDSPKEEASYRFDSPFRDLPELAAPGRGNESKNSGSMPKTSTKDSKVSGIESRKDKHKRSEHSSSKSSKDSSASSHDSKPSSSHSSKHSSSHDSKHTSSHSSKHSSSHDSKYSGSSKSTGKSEQKSDKKSSDSSSKESRKESESHSKEERRKDKSSSKHQDKDSKSSEDTKSSQSKKRKSDHHAKDESSSKKSRRSSQQELGLSFEDCLNMDSSTAAKKTKPTLDYEKLKAKFKVKKKGAVGDGGQAGKSSPGAASLKIKTEDGKVVVPSSSKQIKLSPGDLSSSLPEISASYRPLRGVNPLEEKKNPADVASDFDESLIGLKNYTRTQVYSGRKQVFVPEVYSLQELCLQVLCNSIDSIESVGCVPFYVLKSVLEKCTAMQLYRIEDFNPQFVGETDHLWQLHCSKDFKGSEPEEFESWRELYIRKFDEREAKLKSVRSNISASVAKAVPVRTAKLAYMDTIVKPPREVRRQQMKYGTAGPSGGERSRKIDKFAKAMDPIAINREKREEKNVRQKAPMMQKTLKMIKNIRR